MPNRIIKESICYSDDIDQLTPFEETVFVRLLVNCDDFGRLDARVGFLKSRLFVTKKGVTERNLEDAVRKLATVGLIQIYEVGGKSFLRLPKWDQHQQTRAGKSKYPDPPPEKHTHEQNESEISSNGESDINCNQMISNDINCNQMPPYSYSYSESNSYSKSISARDRASSPAKPPKHKYGEFQNVLLSDDEVSKLKKRFGDSYLGNIEELSKGIELHGYKYKNHYLAILKWAENSRSAPKTSQPEPERTYDIAAYETFDFLREMDALSSNKEGGA